MVEAVKKKQTYYRCEECGFNYADEATAKQCEDWCSRHHSCNIEITKKAVEA